MNSKQRAYLRNLSSTIQPVYQIGKGSITPELTKGLDEALEARELIKIHVLKNCFDDPGSAARTGKYPGRADQFPGRTCNRKNDRIIP